MRLLESCLGLVVLSVLFSISDRGVAQDRPAQQDNKAAGQQDREAWMKLTLPGEPHKRLGALAGKWNQVVRVRTAPDAPWVESKGTAEYKPTLGGRFLMEEVKCSVMGQPFEWVGIYGYDNHRKKYTAVWMDSFGTDTEHGEGQADPAGKVFTFFGEHNDPRTGNKAKFKWVITSEGKDKMRVEMYEINAAGKEFKNLEIIATQAS
jgi:hypothetical protein